MRCFAYVILCLIFSLRVFAAADESSASLIKGSEQPPQESAIQSGRYEVKSGFPVPKVSLKKTNKGTKKTTTKTTTRRVATELKTAETIAEVPTKELTKEPSVTEQVKDLVLGNAQPAVESYKEQVHPDDIRLNRIEINIDPGVIYNDSKSSSSYRNYHSFSPYTQIGARVWLTPMIGIYGKYGTSIGADIVDAASAQSRAAVTHEIMDFGLDFRKFFGLSRRSNSTKFGVHYSEYKFSVPNDNPSRIKTKSSGLGIHFSARFPVAPSYSWVLGGLIEPRLSHLESITALDYQSGDTVESSRVGVYFGGEFKLSRQNQIIWELSSSLEKNQFGGSANLVDPETGIKPSGVSVTNTVMLFTLGYRWGQ